MKRMKLAKPKSPFTPKSWHEAAIALKALKVKRAKQSKQPKHADMTNRLAGIEKLLKDRSHESS